MNSAFRTTKISKHKLALFIIFSGFGLQVLLSFIEPGFIILAQLCVVISIAAVGFSGRVRFFLVLGSLVVWPLVTAFNMSFADPIGSPDAYRYYSYYHEYSSNPSGYMGGLWEDIKASNIYDVSSYALMALLFYPVIDIFFAGNVEIGYLVINFTYAVMAYWICSALVERNTDLGLAFKVGLFVWLLSPVVMYHYQTFTKDIVSTFFCLICVNRLVNRSYIHAAIFLLFATMIRPYSIAIIYAVYYLLMLNYKMLRWGALVALGIVIVFAGPLSLANTVIVMGYMPLSPNIFSGEIGRTDYFLMYIESSVSLVLLLVVAWRSKDAFFFKSVVWPSVLAILIYSAAMTMLGSYSADANDMAYEFGSMGNNALRKKIPVLFIFTYVMAAVFVMKPRAKPMLAKLHAGDAG